MARPILMTQTNRTHVEARGLSAPGFAALAAAFALALAFGLGALAPAQAHAAQATPEQVSVSIPTEVPCALMADGTVVAPSSWTVENEGNVPARLAGASASANYGGLSFSATSSGAVLLKHSNGSTSYDAALLVPAAGSLPITWAVSKVDPAAHPGLAADAARGPVELLSASFSFRGQAASPAVSVTGQRAYKSTLSASPSALPEGAQVASAKWYASVSASGPWSEIAGADSASLALGSDLIGKYVKCRLEYSGGDFDVPASESAACGPISKASAALTVSVSGTAGDGGTLTASASGLPSDCSAQATYTWQASSDGKTWTDFAAGDTLVLGSEQVGKYVRCQASAGTDPLYNVSAGVSAALGPVKAKQVFAVYSADDNSLDFYKRFDVPADGSTFEEKTATAVYTGIETDKYSYSGVVPWKGYASTIVTAVVVDGGISPVSCSYWFNGCSKMSSCDVSKLDTSNVTTMYGMFRDCKSLATLDVSHFDTSQVTSMSAMFQGCSKLATLDVSRFDTSNATDMSYMFYGCSSLATLDVSGFDTSKVISMSNMFRDCKSLATLDVSHFDTSQVTSMSAMFQGCSKLATLDVSRFDTSNATDMTEMFDGCSALASLDVSAWDTSRVTNMSYMFINCSKLATLDVSRFDTSKVTKMTQMFQNCSSLASLDVSAWDTSRVTDMSYMFSSCNSLQEVKFGVGWKWVGTDGFLPSPSTGYIAGADGLWHAKSDGSAYAPADIPSGKADTYYAVAPTWAGAALSVSGEAKVGSTLRAAASGVPAWASLKYQWYRDGSAIVGADSDAYVCVSDDLGHRLTCKASEASGKISGELASGSTAAVGKGSVVLSGTLSTYTPAVNSAVKATVSGVPNAGTTQLTYTWAVADSASAATWTTVKTTSGTTATSDTYTPTPAAVGKYLRCTVSGENAYYVLTSCARTSTATVAQGELATGSAKATLSGEAAYGQTLTAKAAGLPSGAVAKYQWYRGTTAIPGETSQTYKLAQADIGQQIKCVVTDGSGGYKGSLSAAATNAVAKAKAQASVSISGVAKIDQTLTANVAGLPAGDNAVHYQWARSKDKANWTKVGSDASTCKVADGVGDYYRVAVTVSGNPCYDVAGATSAAYGPIAKADAAAPTVTVSGTQTIGNRLTASVSGQPRGTTATSYQWQYSSDGKTWKDSKQSDAKSRDFTPNYTWVNLYARCIVTTSNDYYDVAQAATAAFGPFGKKTVSISAALGGSAVTGGTLTCSVSGLPAHGTNAVSYQWQWSSDKSKWTNSSYSDAKTNSLKLQGADVGYYYRCVVSVSGNAYYDVSGAATPSSAAIGKGTAAAPTVTVSGDAEVGSTLTASVSGQPAGTTSTVYQWQRADSANGTYSNISGATGSTYKPTDADSGKYLKCSVSTASTYYTVPAAASAACGPVKSLQAFAVYSADDNSLNFYKRYGVPSAGDRFEGKTATAVYTGIETDRYSSSINVPWKGYVSTIVTAVVVDGGISPASCSHWFNGCSKMTACDVSRLDTSKATAMGSMFSGCKSLTTLDVSHFDTSKATSMSSMFYNCTSLATLDVSSWDASSVTYMSGMFDGCKSLTTLDVSSWDTSKATSMSGMFDGCKSLASLDVSAWDTSSVTSMSSMFYNCTSLATLDVSSWDASSVTYMPYMFYGCSSLATLDVSHFNTSSATDMSYMFYGCSSLATLDVSHFDTSKVKNMSTMFYSCKSLATLDVSHFDTSKVTNISFMFSSCSSLTDLDVSGWDTSSVTNMSAMFQGCSALTTLDVSHFDTSSVTNMSTMFFGCSSLATLDVSHFDTSKVRNISSMFYSCKSLSTLDVSNFDASNVTNMSSMFDNCTRLQEVSFGAAWKWVGAYGFLPAPSSGYIDGADGKWHAKSDGSAYAPKDIPSGKADTYYAVAPKQAFAVYSADDNSLDFYKRETVPSAGDTFNGKTATEVYTGIETLPGSANSIPWKSHVSTIAAAAVADEGISPISCAYWFVNCGKMASCDVSKLDTTNVTNMTYMFFNCRALTSLDVSHFDTSKVTNMSAMFGSCKSLASLDVSAWDTSSVTSMSSMFYNCTSLATLDVSSWNTSNVTTMGSMFQGCTSLRTLSLSGWSVSKLKTIGGMFDGCTKLQEVSFGPAWIWVSTNGFPPAPSSSYIAGADGKWHAKSDGKAYAPASIPSGKADTYYASKSLRDAAVDSGDEPEGADGTAPTPAQEQGVAACSLPADGEDEASAAPSVEVSLKLAGGGSRAAGPVAVTLSGDAGDAHAVLGKEGAKVALAPGRYLVSCLPAPEADGSMADAPDPFWIEVSDGMGPVGISVGPASCRSAADLQARAAAIENWLAAAAGSVPNADAEALRSAAASALSACQPAEAVSEASDGSE